MSQTLVLPGPYEKLLTGMKPTELYTYRLVQGNRGMLTMQEETIVIPPLNTSISFGTSTAKYDFQQTSVDDEIPKQWDWRNIYPGDTVSILRKKKMISKPLSQGLCGSCWAVCTASAISDKYVVCCDFNPGLSATYLIACYHTHHTACQGGNPEHALYQIKDSGIASNYCVDYRWYNMSNEKDWAHFYNTNEVEERLDKVFKTDVKGCGCYFPQNKYLYKVKNIEVIKVNPTVDDISTQDVLREKIKHHIKKHGPVIGGFHVFRNFLSGNYEATQEVYCENVDYEDFRKKSSSNTKTKLSDSPFECNTDTWQGSHAVVVLGWGETQIESETVSYWYCRNSWGDRWGNDGYFKIAMYPHNKISQLDVTVVVSDKKSSYHQTGGIILFEADSEHQLNSFEKIEWPAQWSNNLKVLYQQPDIHDFASYDAARKSGTFFASTTMIVIGCCLFAFVIVLLMFLA